MKRSEERSKATGTCVAHHRKLLAATQICCWKDVRWPQPTKHTHPIWHNRAKKFLSPRHKMVFLWRAGVIMMTSSSQSHRSKRKATCFQKARSHANVCSCLVKKTKTRTSQGWAQGQEHLSWNLIKSPRKLFKYRCRNVTVLPKILPS